MSKTPKVLGINIKPDEVAPEIGDGNFAINEKLVVTVPLTAEMLEEARASGLNLEEWAAQKAATAFPAAPDLLVSFNRDYKNNLSVEVRVPKEYEERLNILAKTRSLKPPSVASRLIAEFLSAHDAAESARQYTFPIPPAGRVREKDKERVANIRAGLVRLQVRLSESEVERAGDIAAETSRGRRDILGSCLIAALEIE